VRLRKDRAGSPRLGRGAGFLAALLCACSLVPASARATAPTVSETWASAVSSTTARLSARVNPNGLFTTYHFEYLTRAAYEASGNSFAGAARIPISAEANIGSGSSAVVVTQLPSGLVPDTAYRYRILAKNTATTAGPEHEFLTQATGGSSTLADGRGWEMVSPVQKNGGAVASPGEIAGGGVLQAAAQGGSVTYGSQASFAGGQGAPSASQYLATRTSSGWSSENLTVPIFSGSFHEAGEGAPYRIFSTDLARGILLNGDRCRSEGSECAVANPPLPGTDAPAGYRDYYLMEGTSPTALLGSANAGFLALAPKDFELNLTGSSADLKHSVVETCAALTANATEVPAGEGCDPEETNLYEWSGAALTLINLLPAEASGTPGAHLAAQSAAISEDGSRVYFSLGGNLWLRAAGQSKQVDEDAGGGGIFQAASADGAVAYFIKTQHLWRYLVSTGHATDITPAGGVKGVLGAASDGSVIYFQDEAGLKKWSSASTTTLAAGAHAAQESSWPPATGASRVSAEGSRLLFASKEELTGYDNTDLVTSQPDAEIFLRDSSGLTCVSCNPTLGRPTGPSSIPGSVPNGIAAGALDTYKPRVLSANGRRIFFDSEDSLAPADTDQAPDAYQWEAQGEGSCSRQGGCISLLSSGRSAGGASFADASADGADAFFLTAGSLVNADNGAVDLYDARVDGGFPEAIPPIACQGDSCQPLPSPPRDPTLTTLLTGPGNPPVRFPKEKKCPKDKVKHGKCVKKKGKAKAKPRRGTRRRPVRRSRG
jgi:hypothetical protein